MYCSIRTSCRFLFSTATFLKGEVNINSTNTLVTLGTVKSNQFKKQFNIDIAIFDPINQQR